jgi:hypothetical protein
MWFSPLENKSKGKKAPTMFWLSGSFYKQWCDEKHMAWQSGEQLWGLCCPLENQKARLHCSGSLGTWVTPSPCLFSGEVNQGWWLWTLQ